MKRMGRLLALTLGTTILTVSLMACGGETTPGTDSAGNSGDLTEGESSGDTTAAPGQLPFTDEEITISIGLEQSTVIEDFSTNKMTLYMEEQTGLSFDFTLYPANEMLTILELSVSTDGTDLPDVLIGGFSQNVIMPWAKAGMIIPLNEYYDDLFYWGQETIDTDEALSLDEIKRYITSYDGNIYGMYGYNSTLNNQYSGGRLNIYRPWLEELGIDMPTTTDELYDMLVAFRDSDLNRNGIADEIPLTGYNEGTSFGMVRKYLMTPFIYTQDEYWITDNGQIDVAFNKDGWREGLQFAHKLYEEELMDPSMFTQDQATMTVALSQDEQIVGSFVRFSSTNMSAEDTNRYLYDRSEYVVGPSGEARKSVSPAIPSLRGLISKNAEEPELAFMMLDYMNGYDLSVITRYGFEGEDFHETDQEAERAALEAFWDEQPVHYPNELYGEGFEIPVNAYSYDQSTWGTLQNTWWAQIGPNTMTEPLNKLFTAAGTIDTEREQMNYVAEFRHYYFLTEAHELRDEDQIVAGLIYTEEEQQVITDYYSEIKSYVEESWASFVTGSLDIDDDGTWNSYITQINNMNLEECISVTQQAYDRQRG